ncbi:hotdog fold domain-containing protein [Flocculibacter collagenilyticus]|uniref:hotdog fold domain-containing protein n=1 Tax=Flocculibacter collagenilyticus TaxID=2744479 RepID=UPI0018F36A7D|nr:hotdog fold domain-containing protein [Flocculibacter collagenilyticus]
MSKSNKTLNTFNKLKRLPFGKKIFSYVVSKVAPYFSTINPHITTLTPNYCECLIKKQKKVFNHIQTVHVIAICNGLEMAMGVMAEASIPPSLRWIPKGMSVDYTAKAGSDIRCVASVSAEDWKPGDMLVNVTAYDENSIVVVKGHIKLWISEKPIKETE